MKKTNIDLSQEQYRKIIKKEVVLVLNKFQQSSKSGDFNGKINYIVNLFYCNYSTMNESTNRFLNSYLKYNNHMKEDGKRKNRQIILSYELGQELDLIINKYCSKLGLTGLIDLCGDSHFKFILNNSSYFEENFNESYNNYKVLFQYEKLQTNLKINTLPVKKVSKV